MQLRTVLPNHRIRCRSTVGLISFSLIIRCSRSTQTCRRQYSASMNDYGASTATMYRNPDSKPTTDDTFGPSVLAIPFSEQADLCMKAGFRASGAFLPRHLATVKKIIAWCSAPKLKETCPTPGRVLICQVSPTTPNVVAQRTLGESSHEHNKQHAI